MGIGRVIKGLCKDTYGNGDGGDFFTAYKCVQRVCGIWGLGLGLWVSWFPLFGVRL